MWETNGARFYSLILAFIRLKTVNTTTADIVFILVKC